MSDWLNVEVDHSAYYRWVPMPEHDADPDTSVDSTFPGQRMQRILINEATTSTCQVRMSGVAQFAVDRVAAELPVRSDLENLVTHLCDGPWAKHFPLETITAIRADDPAWETGLVNALVTRELETAK